MHETRSRAAVAKARLAEFIEHLGVDFPHELRVEEGKPASVIVHVAEEINADLICMPTRGHGPLRTFLLGSTTAKVLNDAHVPVLTNSHLKDSKDVNAPELRNIVCGLSLDDQGKRALDAAMMLAKTFNANLTVVHALESDNPSVSDRVFEAVRSAAEQPPVLPGIVISNGNIPQIVETIAKDRHADLVVIGRSAPSPLGRLRANSYAIIRSAPCPVLSV
jgi:nucleotide-binding universal stress UspA family protein